MRLLPLLLAFAWASPALAQTPLIRGVNPSSGPPGTLVKIIVEGLDDISMVRFNGHPADFRVVSELHIKAVVPADATSGPITVSNQIGTATSPRPFVIPAGSPPAAPQWSLPRPNPGSDHIAWTLALGRAALVRVEICDAQGRGVRILGSGELPAGLHELTWDLRDARGRRVPCGLYLVRLVAGAIVRTSRIAVTR